jgi:hypothetical protein
MVINSVNAIPNDAKIAPIKKTAPLTTKMKRSGSVFVEVHQLCYLIGRLLNRVERWVVERVMLGKVRIK